MVVCRCDCFHFTSLGAAATTKLLGLLKRRAAFLQVVPFKGFNIRNDDHIRAAISRSNLVVNLLGLEKETVNFSFEDVHVDAAARIANIAAESDLLERFWHVGCLSASESSSSRRLRTLVSPKNRWPHAHCVRLSNSIDCVVSHAPSRKCVGASFI